MHKRGCRALRGGRRSAARAAKAELLRAVAVMVGCRNVLTIGQHMSRLHSHGTSGGRTQVGGPERSEVRYPISQAAYNFARLTNGEARGSRYSKQSFRSNRQWLDDGGTSYYAPRLRAAIVGTGGISVFTAGACRISARPSSASAGAIVTKARSVANDFRPCGRTDVRAGDISIQLAGRCLR